MNDFLLGKPQDGISTGAEICVSSVRVTQVCLAMSLILFRADAIACFNDQFQLPAVKIDNMVPDRVLPSEPDTVRPL